MKAVIRNIRRAKARLDAKVSEAKAMMPETVQLAMHYDGLVSASKQYPEWKPLIDEILASKR